MRVNGAVPVSLCNRLVDVLESALGVPVNDPSRWDAYGGEMRDLVPIWGHQAQWDIRQHPNLHHHWAKLWGTEKLCVSLDSCRFTPPWREGHAEPSAIHWDHNPWDAEKRMFQGVLALTDTAADQGGFCCIPSLYLDSDAWPRQPIIYADGEEDWLADTRKMPCRRPLNCFDYRRRPNTDANSAGMPPIRPSRIETTITQTRQTMYGRHEIK
jgi:hypothetical protein